MTEELWRRLCAHSNHRGLALISEPKLLLEQHVTHEVIQAALTTLERDRRIEVLAPLPYLVVKLLSWSGSSTTRSSKTPINSSVPAPSHIEVPVSSSSYVAAIQSREVGVAGEGEALLAEVLGALGPEADREEFRAILARYSPSLVRRCLRRVMATKAIRVSRTALFRALLIKLSH